jgi:photosystem II stability/assembly factor-like uncharacterized protein
MYVGTDRGVVTLRGENSHSWSIENQGLDSWAVPGIAVDPSAPNRVLAGTRGDGVWVSEDFGKSWTKPCYGKPGPGKVRCLTLDPKDARVVYAGGEPIDVFVSEDLGASWERLDSVRKVPWVETVTYPVAVVEPHVRDIAIDPNDPRKMLIALQVGAILKTTDGGATWEHIDKEYDCDVHTIVIDPENTDHILIATGGHDARGGRVNGRALYATKDGGETWEPRGLEMPQEYSVPLTMQPGNPRILLSALAHGQPNSWRRPTGAESVVIRSWDGGESWEPLSKGLEDVSMNFAEAIAFDESSPDHVYAALRNGELYASDDCGDSWTKLDVKVPNVASMTCVPV